MIEENTGGVDMRYLLLIYTGEGAPAEGSDEAVAEMQEWYEYTEELRAAGALLGGEPLQPVETAVTVRVRNGEITSTDGPFAETKEILGGFYMINVDTQEEAERWAAKIPSSRYGSTEVRPIAELPAAD
jgi:hypothetical protein